MSNSLKNQTSHRSETRSTKPPRSFFGYHCIELFTYSTSKNKSIASTAIRVRSSQPADSRFLEANSFVYGFQATASEPALASQSSPATNPTPLVANSYSASIAFDKRINSRENCRDHLKMNGRIDWDHSDLLDDGLSRYAWFR